VAGLRRCLIIFAPRTLILDRRTCTCRTPSLLLISQRSKNFTSGAAISFTPNSPIGCDRWVQVMGTRSPAHRGETGSKWSRENTHQVAQSGPQGQHNSNATLGRYLDIPWMDIQPSRGCFEHTEFSRVSTTVGSDGGRGICPAQAGSPCVRSQCGRHDPLWPAMKQAFGRSDSHHQKDVGAGTYHWGLNPAPPRQNPSRKTRAHPGSGWPPSRPAARWQTTSVLTAAMLVYALGAGITAAAGTRLALQLILITVFG
jgi:hypothetical protein